MDASPESPAPAAAPAAPQPRSLATVVVSAGRPAPLPGAPVNVPIELSSTYAVRPDAIGYGRAENATWTAFEDALGALEGGRALVFASGMAAIDAALRVAPGNLPLVAPTTPYNTTSALLEERAAAGGEVRRVAIDDTAAVIAALDGAGAIWLESPTNPLMQVADLAAIIPAAKARGLVVICDNTFATPLLQRPLELGADLVVHSVTKYLSGHSDVLLGAVVSAPAARELREQVLTHRTRRGAIAGPMETWLALRGLRTLDVRLRRACDNAAYLAQRLADHPAVCRVRYPGWGAMLAIDVVGGHAEADRVVAATRLWLGATSLGGVESLIERRRRYPGESDLVPESLLRLSVGIEDPADLWADLNDALAAALT
ncbi:MAG: PLP-dependent transferase [Actinomycetales bacterium]|nr:PLP-dependent transferase [Actinomycetales bacterium]HMT32545.1 PLP-dependent transferase [Dermatophilaceae bacterium]